MKILVCKHCGLAVGQWQRYADSPPYWKHHAGGGKKSCGKKLKVSDLVSVERPEKSKSTITPDVEWRDVPGYPAYAVTIDGRVLSRLIHGRHIVTEHFQRYLKPYINAKGYPVVILGANRPTAVHRLVLLSFVGPSPEGMEGCHYDGTPSNNHLRNLRWDTSKANAQDRARHGRESRTIGEANGLSKLTVQIVKAIRRRCANGERQHVVAADYGINPSNVSYIVRRKTWVDVP